MQFPQPISAAPLPLWTPLTPAQNFRKAEKIPHAENLRRVNGSNLHHTSTLESCLMLTKLGWCGPMEGPQGTL